MLVSKTIDHHPVASEEETVSNNVPFNGVWYISTYKVWYINKVRSFEAVDGKIHKKQ